MSTDKNNRISITVIITILIIIYCTGLIILAKWRHIDGDEGYYASAVGLVAEGKIVYGDFLYPQAPLLPYVYTLAHNVNASIATLRTFSAILSVLMVLSWCIFLFNKYNHVLMAVPVALSFLILDPYLASWNVVVKTYSLSNLLLTLSLVLLYFALKSEKRIWFIVSGICSGFLISVRLLYIPVVLIIVLYLLKRDFFGEKSKKSTFFGFFIGLILGGLPAFIIFITNPDAFIFNNIGYHLIRDNTPGIKKHLPYALMFFLKILIQYPYLIIIIGLGLIGLFIPEKSKKHDGFTYLIVAVSVTFIFCSSLPYPLWAQYYTATLGTLLFPLTAAGVIRIYKWKTQFIWALILIASLISFKEVSKESFRHSKNSVWDLSTYKSISNYVADITQPDDIVLSFWTGHVYESDRRYYPKLESHTGLIISSKLSRQQRDDYKVISKENILSAIDNKLPKIVIMGAWMRNFYRNLNESERVEFFRLLEENYILSKKIDVVSIYMRRE